MSVQSEIKSKVNRMMATFDNSEEITQKHAFLCCCFEEIENILLISAHVEHVNTRGRSFASGVVSDFYFCSASADC